ncbi:MAG: aminoacyl-histidine dipeptidase [Paludibacteraceae bacterium]|nr:aminoacyl-histidine dipeptidase [Paludibacteraceae bacterium]
MVNEIEQLEPKGLWHYFAEICKVPRPSKHEEKIREYLVAFGNEHHLETINANGNVLIRKSPSKGYEAAPGLLFQAHMDMVCEKNADVAHDFSKDPILPYIDNGWVKARGTTLGADDGMGVAAMLAVLADNNIEHGPLECLFTFDEETGLSGAKEMPAGVLQSKYLVNLDSEEDGEFCIGCAGGVDTTATFSYQPQTVPDGFSFFRVTVNGLQGGHSGSDIDKNRGNAVQLLARFINMLYPGNAVLLAEFNGGNLRNAIAREATAVIGLPAAKKEQVRIVANLLLADLQNEYPNEPGLKLTVESVVEDAPRVMVDTDTAKCLVRALVACPHGVMGMSQDLPGLVETSTNLASVKMQNDYSVLVTTSQRSSVASRKEEVKNKVAAVFRLAGAAVAHGDGYPGWKPNVNSAIKEVLAQAYEDLFKQTPSVGAIHAGLECGLFLEKYPDLDMISCGPTIRGVHSPAEKVEIASVGKFWLLLLDVMKRMKSLK